MVIVYGLILYLFNKEDLLNSLYWPITNDHYLKVSIESCTSKEVQDFGLQMFSKLSIQLNSLCKIHL